MFTHGMPTFESFANKTPILDIADYLNGQVRAWGFLQSRYGKVTRRFTVKMNGSWQGNKGVLSEDFIFDDGENQQRIWTITKHDDQNFEASAADVVGKAIGKQQGCAINMHYTLNIPVKGRNIAININDWLIAIDQRRVMNVSSLTKFGFNVGRLTIFFEKD